jgi:hypothetical protein
VFQGQYLPLSLSKRGVPYIKKTKRKKKASAKQKQEPHKKKSEVRLSDFTKPANLSDFTRAENWSDLACPFCPILPSLRTYPILPGLKTGPILLVRFARFYQGCELVHFYQG